MTKRPLGIVLLSIWMGLEGILGIFETLFNFLTLNPFIILLGSIWFIIYAIHLYLAYGLWNGIERARKLTIYIVAIVPIFMLIITLILLVISPWKTREVLIPIIVMIIMSIIFAVIVIYYLTRPHIKEFFNVSQTTLIQESNVEISKTLESGLEVLKHKSSELSKKLEKMISGDIIEDLKKYREEKEKLEYYLKNLLDTYEKGEISEKSYKELKEKYENELKTVEKKITKLFSEIERRREQYKKEIEQLKFEKNVTLKLLKDIEDKYKNGEIDEEVYRKRKTEIENKLNFLEQKINKLDKLIKKFENIQ